MGRMIHQPEDFITHPHRVKAMRFDGTDECFEAIRDWLDSKGKCYWKPGQDGPEWVVWDDETGLTTYDDDRSFFAAYRSVAFVKAACSIGTGPNFAPERALLGDFLLTEG